MVKKLIYVAPHAIGIEEEAPIAALRSDQAILRAEFTGISRGTERLVFEGRLPPSEYERMRAPLQEGSFPYPVVYGYAAVGVVEDGPSDWAGRRAFALAPHRTHTALPVSALTPLPDALPSRRAVLTANMETALNALWDGGAGPGDRIAVVGCGVVGGLIASLAARLPGADVLVVDPEPTRAEIATAFDARYAPEAPHGFEADLVVHASASAAGLRSAIELAGEEATVLEASWHGAGETAIALGGAFHSRRLKLVSTQVGRVASSRRPRWSYARRLAKAVELLCDPRYDAFITCEIAFEDAPQALPAAFAYSAELGVVLKYGAAAATEKG